MLTIKDAVQNGFLNTDSPDISDLITDSRWAKATYCNSPTCTKDKDLKRGKLVFTGNHYLNSCPDCGAVQTLYFQEVKVK